MKEKPLNPGFTQRGESPTVSTVSPFSALPTKPQARSQSYRRFPVTGDICVLCGAAATERHSKSGHTVPVCASDIVLTCLNCHQVIHTNDGHRGRASAAFRSRS